MDHLVSLNNLLYDSFGFLLVHLPHFAYSVVVAFLESLVFLLKLLEHLSEILKLFGTLDIFSLELSKFLFIFSFNFSDDVLETSLSQTKQQRCLFVDSCSFS